MCAETVDTVLSSRSISTVFVLFIIIIVVVIINNAEIRVTLS